MGSPKALLQWHGASLLSRVCALLRRAVDGPVIVVVAAGQALPALPAEIEITRDVREGRGPLQALAAGLTALTGRADDVFVSGADAPLLHPAFVRRMLAALQGTSPRCPDAAVAILDGHTHPLAGAYRTSITTSPPSS